MDPLLRHIAACDNAVLPGGRTPLLLDGQPAGYVAAEAVAALLGLGATRVEGGLALAAERLEGVGRALAEAGFGRWRGEAFDVRAEAEGPVLARVDRGVLPVLGIRAVGVHLNALVWRGDGLHVWVARRAANKQLDPGKLDHLVAGGVPAGLSPWEALLKEAEEEAGLPAALLEGAQATGIVEYAMARPEGLRRDRLHCWDVTLPEGFVPEARDGEVEGFELWPVERVLARVRETDDFKFNVNLVLIGLFRRLRLVSQA